MGPKSKVIGVFTEEERVTERWAPGLGKQTWVYRWKPKNAKDGPQLTEARKDGGGWGGGGDGNTVVASQGAHLTFILDV